MLSHSRRTKDLWYTSCQEGLDSNLGMLKWGSRTLSPFNHQHRKNHMSTSQTDKISTIVFFWKPLFLVKKSNKLPTKTFHLGSSTHNGNREPNLEPWVRSVNPRIASQVLVALELGEPRENRWVGKRCVVGSIAVSIVPLIGGIGDIYIYHPIGNI